MSVWGPSCCISAGPQENGIKMLWTETWEVVTALAEPSRSTPANHDCVCEFGLVGHLSRNDSIAEVRRRFGGVMGHVEPRFRRAGPGIQTGSGVANLTLETGQAFNALWFSQEEHTLDAHRAENGSVQIHIPIQISQLPTPGLPKSPCPVSRAPGPFRQRSSQRAGWEYPAADILQPARWASFSTFPEVVFKLIHRRSCSPMQPYLVSDELMT